MPRRVYLRDADFRRYGYTEGCRKCAILRATAGAPRGHDGQGVPHSPACRARLQAAMEVDGDERLRKAEDNIDDAIARRTEPASTAHRAEGESGQAGGPGDGAEPRAAGEDEEMRVEEAEEEMVDACFKQWPEEAGREATRILELVLVHGASLSLGGGAPRGGVVLATPGDSGHELGPKARPVARVHVRPP